VPIKHVIVKSMAEKYFFYPGSAKNLYELPMLRIRYYSWTALEELSQKIKLLSENISSISFHERVLVQSVYDLKFFGEPQWLFWYLVIYLQLSFKPVWFY